MKKRRYVPNLVADMAECDANYIRLRQLFPEMDSEDDMRFGIRPVGLSTRTKEGALVQIVITERCPFTTMVNVTVEAEADEPLIRWPKLSLRVYHDVCSAEVVEFQRHRNFLYRYSTPNKEMFQPDEKSQINKYLGELLTYCIEHGYSLEPVQFH